MSSSVQSKKNNNNHDFIWKELSLQNNVKVYYCMQIQANKIAHIYLGAYIYLRIWVLHKTDVGNFFTYVMILFFFQYTSAIAMCRRELKRLPYHRQNVRNFWVSTQTLLFILTYFIRFTYPSIEELSLVKQTFDDTQYIPEGYTNHTLHYFKNFEN